MQKDKTKGLLGGQFKPFSTFSPLTLHGKNAEKGLNFLSFKGRVLGAHLAVSEEEFITPCAGRKTFFSPSCPKIDLPTSLEITVGSEIYIQKKDLHPSIKNRLLRLATFPNPEFYRAQAMKLPTHDKPRMISCATEHPDYISLPRGCFESLCQLLSDLNIKMSIQEDLQEGTSLKTKFLGDLRGEQKIAAATLLNTNLGVLSATTGFGKTVIGAYLIAKRKTNTLILVHRKQLQEQWIQRLSSFLDLPPDSVGRIGGGHKKSTGIIDVALIQSLMRKGSVDQAISQYGQIIVDECHHLPAISFEQVISKAKAKYITGLTATVARKDGHHPIIFMRCGHLRYRVDPKKAAKLHPFEHTVFVRPTSFCPVKPSDVDMRRQLYNLYAELIHDEERNQMMCDEVVSSVKKGRSPIVLTERTEHLARLAELLTPRVSNLVVLRGGMNSKNMAEVTKRIAAIPAKEERVLLATGSLIGEGFDDARLDTLFLTMPISWKGTVAQYVGRLHRLSAEKREVQVYDYADLGVPLLERMFNRRCQGYEAVGYQILLPASAIPGWPAQIPLPIDPEWKADYAGSVRRLVLDGVDMPLAQLFVQATVPPPQPADVSYARSATESFFFRRLKSLPQTAGKFQLNARLNIPFDGWGQMEVDFLCADARLVIELDGAQHLGSTEAYRRDRRKDALLQENGYTVLRFLAEDVGKELEAVLDSILRFMCKEKNIKIQSKF